MTGSIGPATREALANYQQDAGLEATGAIDAATVEALGLY
ncbi:MAG: peptidoglycan-binding protein [Verrucomicrobiota bacterium]|nr:peptidoglycan-binding protein [Verrucomicrobiota bacterium]